MTTYRRALAVATASSSDSITSFRITPHGLVRVDVEPSNGDRPTSATVDGDLLYVLNAHSNEITGFRVDRGELPRSPGRHSPRAARPPLPSRCRSHLTATN
jgi:6-phosphogluconolactonase